MATEADLLLAMAGFAACCALFLVALLKCRPLERDALRSARTSE
jgi:hypothetical protein